MREHFEGNEPEYRRGVVHGEQAQRADDRHAVGNRHAQEDEGQERGAAEVADRQWIHGRRQSLHYALCHTGGGPMSEARSEIRDGMRIDWDVPIRMDDGLVLRCDVYRPIEDGKYPVILSYGPYAKWLHFEQIYKTCWDK